MDHNNEGVEDSSIVLPFRLLCYSGAPVSKTYSQSSTSSTLQVLLIKYGFIGR
jgi:hypothetical protein